MHRCIADSTFVKRWSSVGGITVVALCLRVRAGQTHRRARSVSRSRAGRSSPALPSPSQTLGPALGSSPYRLCLGRAGQGRHAMVHCRSDARRTHTGLTRDCPRRPRLMAWRGRGLARRGGLAGRGRAGEIPVWCLAASTQLPMPNTPAVRGAHTHQPGHSASASPPAQPVRARKSVRTLPGPAGK